MFTLESTALKLLKLARIGLLDITINVQVEFSKNNVQVGQPHC
jgi:hypothetical protein